MKDEFFEEYEKLGIRIAYFRRIRNYTQQELGGFIGIDAQHISKLERAEVGMSMDMLFKLSRALKIPASKLLDFSEIDENFEDTKQS